MNYKFKISVVIPVYNCEKFLENCLESLHAQTMSSDEYQIIFVNDGSTDSSGEICESFTREKNVVYFEKENGGVSSARNKGIELAQGKYILFLDSDDTLSPNTFESVYNFFEEHYSETDIVTYTINYLSEKGVLTTHRRYDYLTQDGIYDMEPRTLQTTMNICVKNLPGDEMILFDESLSLGEDQFFIFSWMMKKQKFGFVKDAEYTYYRHSNSASSTMNNPYYCFEQYTSFLEKLLDFTYDGDRINHPVAQALVIYNLSWRITSDTLVCHIDSETESRQLEKLREILNRVNNNIICNSIYIDPFHVEYLMRLKGEKGNCVFNSNSFSAYGDDSLWLSQNYTVVFNTLKVHDNKFCIAGYIKNSFFSFKDIDFYYTDIHNEKHIIQLRETVLSYYKSRTKTNSFGGFDFEIELEDQNAFMFGMEINGFIITPRIIFGYLCCVNGSKYKTACNDYSVEYKAKSDYFRIEKDNPAAIAEYTAFADNVVKAENKRALAYRKIARKYKREKEIWIYCDRENIFDNAYYQFLHDFSIDDGVERYYIIDGLKDRSKYFNSKQRANLVEFKSIKHKLLFLNCNKILTSFNSVSIISPFGDMPLKWYSDITDYEVIYLQHGILHANLPLLYSKERANVNKIVVSSEFEIKNFKEIYNFKEKDLIPTGMPRFDSIDMSKKHENRILFSPSWRKNLIGDYVNNTRDLFEDKFLASPFFNRINEFLNSEKLAELLEKYDLTLDFKNHPIFSPYDHCFTINNPRVNIMNETVEMQKYALMITDYSSIVFDFVYLHRPIVYFVPDYELFKAGVTHTYYKLDLPLEDGFGEVTQTADELLKALEDIFGNDFKSKPIYDERMSRFFISKSEHCKGLYDALKSGR